MSPNNSVTVLGAFLTPHRILHFTAFGFLSICLSLTGRKTRQRILAPTSVIAFATLLEVTQFISSANPFEFWDVRDDASAACAGFVLVEAYFFIGAHIQAAHRP